MATLKTLALIGLLAILAGIAAAVYFFGGYYSVAGTAEDPAVVKWALTKVRQASITRHAQDRPPMSLDDPATVQAGARAFSERGCVNCHGGPGVNWAKFSEGLRPDPPDLKELADEISPPELFWVIKHGIKASGMPAWGKSMDDRFIWGLVAFVERLPRLDAAQYRALVASSEGHSHGGRESSTGAEVEAAHAHERVEQEPAMAPSGSAPAKVPGAGRV